MAYAAGRTEGLFILAAEDRIENKRRPSISGRAYVPARRVPTVGELQMPVLLQWGRRALDLSPVAVLCDVAAFAAAGAFVGMIAVVGLALVG